MARIKVTVIGADKFVKDTQIFVQKLLARQLKQIAVETQFAIRQKITDSIRRGNSTGNLANSFFAEQFPGGWGVGNITFLNQQAPYWRHVNFGSRAIGASHSHRVPQGGFSPGTAQPIPGGNGGRWIVGSNNFSFIPTQPIAPLNYIAKTVQELSNIASRVLSRG